MASLTSAPSSVVSAGNWTGAANTYASDNAYATYTLAATNTDYPFEVGGFDFSSVPADSIVESVTVLVENKASATSNATMSAQLFDGATPIGAATALTLGTADADRTFVVTGVTLTQLKSANLKVRVTGRKSTSQARTLSVDRVALTASYVVPGAKVETYTDDFSGDLSKWTYGNVTLSSGQASLNVNSGVYAYMDTTPFSRLDFRGSSLFAKWTLPTMAGTNECFLQVNYDTANYISAFRSGDDSTLYLRVRKAGVNTTTSGTFTDNWWRLRESGGTAYLDTSPDGSTWTQRLSLAHGLSDSMLAQVYIEVTAGDYGTAGAKAFLLDNVNTAPGGAVPTGSGSGAWSISGSATGAKAQAGSASGSWAASGAAAGSAPMGGSASFGWGMAAEAAGSADRKGSTSGGWAVEGSATGGIPREGSASGSWLVGGSAAGLALTRDIELVAELLRDRLAVRLTPERAEASLAGHPVRATLTEHPVTASMEVESWHVATA